MSRKLTKADCLKDPVNYPWAEHMAEDDFVIEGRENGESRLDLFDDRVFVTGDEKTGDIRYYVYDPVAHGMPADRKYPVIFAFHGTGGSLVGKTAIGWAGVERYASPGYQKKVGGAYIVVPLANEVKMPEGYCVMDWMTPVEQGKPAGYEEGELPEVLFSKEADEYVGSLLGRDSVYTAGLLRLIRTVLDELPCAGKRFIFGASAGGYALWRIIIDEPGLFDAALIMAGAYLPSRKELKLLDEAGIRIWICHARYDECVPYGTCVGHILPLLQGMKNVSLYLPELSHRADGSVASNINGMQMGQHCISDCVHEDLMYADGSPMDPAHPQGVLGWIRDLCGAEG
ncbi:MAG: hypothetical protein CW338_01680 [Clostridiales bacterium]|nr:hypothetical protein [Clostridiales bacterium]